MDDSLELVNAGPVGDITLGSLIFGQVSVLITISEESYSQIRSLE